MAYDLPASGPYTDLRDVRLLEQTLDARSHHRSLVKMGRGQLDAWVQQNMASEITSFTDCATDDITGQATEFVQLDYSELVHNRVGVQAERVASLVHLLLHDPNVDIATIEMQRLDPEAWAATLDAGRVSPDDRLRVARWHVLEGNHRTVAPHLLGIGAIAKTRGASARMRYVSFG